MTAFEVAMTAKMALEVKNLVKEMPSLTAFIQHAKAALSPSAFPHKELWGLVSKDELKAAKDAAEILYNLEQLS